MRWIWNRHLPQFIEGIQPDSYEHLQKRTEGVQVENRGGYQVDSQ